jgi:hypothetical protein
MHRAAKVDASRLRSATGTTLTFALTQDCKSALTFGMAPQPRLTYSMDSVGERAMSVKGLAFKLSGLSTAALSARFPARVVANW